MRVRDGRAVAINGIRGRIRILRGAEFKMAEKKPEEKSERGFASMNQDKQRQIASKGGKAAHEKGSAHEFSPEEASTAGRKGGEAAQGRGTAHKFTPEERERGGRKGGQKVSTNREHMARIGRKGGERRGAATANITQNISEQRSSPENPPQQPVQETQNEQNTA